MMRPLLVLWLIMLATASAYAHEMRPAFLDMRETADDEFSILWKVPALGDRRLSLYLRLPETCKYKGEPVRAIEGNSFHERSIVVCPGGLAGRSIVIDGLRATLTDTLARISYRDGTAEVARLTPERPAMEVAGKQSGWQVVETYFRLGVDHILSGLDHLLFVFGLILLIRNPWMLAKAITAFTVAHSITLIGATLGYVSLPQLPVEAVVALSIAFVARELVVMKPGEPRLSQARPWLVAFAFGLLHGFGFAGALGEIGLPQSDIPLALLAFNLGVEAGQLLFVAVVLILWRAVRVLVDVPLAPARTAAGYLIGTVAVIWLMSRLGDFVA